MVYMKETTQLTTKTTDIPSLMRTTIVVNTVLPKATLPVTPKMEMNCGNKPSKMKLHNVPLWTKTPTYIFG